MGIASGHAHAIGLPVEWSSCDSAAIAEAPALRAPNWLPFAMST